MANANKTAFMMKRATQFPSGYGTGGGDVGWTAHPDMNTFWQTMLGSAVTCGLRKGTVIMAVLIIPSEVAAPSAGTVTIVNTTASTTLHAALDLTVPGYYELDPIVQLAADSYFTFTPTSQTANTGAFVGLRTINPPNKI
jgi:hypothetical protein